MSRLMLVNISTLLLQFEKCIVIDICDTPPLLDIFFTFPPAGPQTKGLVKQQADFPTQFPVLKQNPEWFRRSLVGPKSKTGPKVLGTPVLWYCGPRGVSHVNRTKLTRLFRGVVIGKKDRSTNQTMVPVPSGPHGSTEAVVVPSDKFFDFF